MKDVVTGELLAKIYLTLDADEKAFFFNKIGSVLRKEVQAVKQMPDQQWLGSDGRKAIKSFTDPFFAARFDERSAGKDWEAPTNAEGVHPPSYVIERVLDCYKNLPNVPED